MCQIFLFTVGGFSNDREYSGADWLDPLIYRINLILNGINNRDMMMNPSCRMIYEISKLYFIIISSGLFFCKRISKNYIRIITLFQYGCNISNIFCSLLGTKGEQNLWYILLLFYCLSVSIYELCQVIRLTKGKNVCKQNN